MSLNDTKGRKFLGWDDGAVDFPNGKKVSEF